MCSGAMRANNLLRHVAGALFCFSETEGKEKISVLEHAACSLEGVMLFRPLMSPDTRVLGT